MKGSRRDPWLHARLLLLVFLPACGNPGYNDNPSQQITTARVGCLAAGEFFAVYYDLHLQPAGANSAAAASRDLFRAYCEELPAPGKVFLTIDLPGPALKRTPLGIRVRGPASGVAGGAAEARQVFELPPKTYRNGLIEARFDLTEGGEYAISLTRGDAVPAAGDSLIIPLQVGAGRFSLPGWASALGLLVALAGGLAVRHWVRSKSP